MTDFFLNKAPRAKLNDFATRLCHCKIDLYKKVYEDLLSSDLSKYFSFSAKNNDDDIELDVTKDGEELSVHHPQFLTIFRMLCLSLRRKGVFFPLFFRLGQLK